MKIIVSDIPEEGLQQDVDLKVSIDNSEPAEDVHVSVRVNRYGERVMLDGSAGMSVSLVCSRCLKRFRYPISVEFHEEYVPRPDAVDEEHELTDEELALNYYINDMINLDEFIREQVIVSIPIKPLCKANCMGICPMCGKDLNEGSCDCKKEDIDPRLSALKRMLSERRRDG
jgi:uncharacterized protein